MKWRDRLFVSEQADPRDLSHSPAVRTVFFILSTILLSPDACNLTFVRSKGLEAEGHSDMTCPRNMNSLCDRCCYCCSNACIERSGELLSTSKIQTRHTSKIERIRFLLGARFWRHCHWWNGSIDWRSLIWGGHRGEVWMGEIWEKTERSGYLCGLQIK